MLSFFPRGVLDEILNLIESVSEGFLPTLVIVFFFFFFSIGISSDVVFCLTWLSTYSGVHIKNSFFDQLFQNLVRLQK